MTTVKKVNPNNEESFLQKSLKIITDLEKEAEKVNKARQRILRQQKDVFDQLCRTQAKFEKRVIDILEGHNAHLKRVIKINEHVDETVCNVLLAIRQNEYLQAYYPKKVIEEENSENVHQ